MTKKDFVAAVAERTGTSKKITETVIDAVFSEIKDNLIAGEKVAINGFGSFEVRNRGERMGTNPSTKEKVKIPACKAPAFKAAKALKDAVNR